MDDGRFRVLLHTLKSMRNSEPRLANAIIRAIGAFEEAMTDEQKKEILQEFARYEKLRKEMEDIWKAQQILAEEKYRELVGRGPIQEDRELESY